MVETTPSKRVRSRRRGMTNKPEYPTQAEIKEFLEAKRKGGVEAIANLLREKQAKRAQALQSQEISAIQPADKEMKPSEKTR